MTTFHLAGFPRVGAKRELKFAQERYWRGEIAEADLLDIAKRLRELNWQHQAKANADFVAVADFTLYTAESVCVCPVIYRTMNCAVFSTPSEESTVNS